MRHVEPLSLPGVVELALEAFTDPRGVLVETFHAARHRELGIAAEFVQDNFSRSVRGTLRGLHFQLRQPQGKLVTVLRGEIFDVAVDIRAGSPTFGQWCGRTLSETNRRQLWIPPGFAHGFLAVSDEADVLYKLTAPYVPDDQHAIRWNDRRLAIAWPLAGEPQLSAKDASAPPLAEAALPGYAP